MLESGVMRLTGKVALISGGSKGIGACQARLFAREGASVVIGDVLEEEGKRVEAEINEAGGQALFLGLDVTREPDWQRVVQDTVLRFGKLDVLVNNAGIYNNTPVEDATEDEWRRVMEVNAKGAFLGTKSVVSVMREAGAGSIVNISSIAGVVGYHRGSVYGAAKAAVSLLTKATAIQHAKDGIRANSVRPGPIDTEMIAANLATPEGSAEVIGRVPLGRVGTVEDVAYGALFLASDESSYMTGAELVIDGGLTAQ